MQIRDLNKGTFGFVQLAQEIGTGIRVAIKFIERGDKVLHIAFQLHIAIRGLPVHCPLVTTRVPM